MALITIHHYVIYPLTLIPFILNTIIYLLSYDHHIIISSSYHYHIIIISISVSYHYHINFIIISISLSYHYHLRAAAPAADPGRMVNEWNQIGSNILRCFAPWGFPLFHMYKIFWYSNTTHPPNPFTPRSSSSTTSTRVWVLSSWNYSFY